jgi:hypothetical protein
LLAYGADLEDIVRRAPYVDRILRGANPAELPVRVPVKFETVVNVKTARALDLEVALCQEATAARSALARIGTSALGDTLDAAAASHRPGARKKSTHGRLFTRAISIP